MPDTKITALTAITTVDPAADVLPIVDVSDTSMAASGTTKKITSNQILGAGGTATLASATITGDLTVDTSTLKVDSANNRVGINTASPSTALDVFGGNIRLVGGNIFQILNTSNDSNVDISNNGGSGVASMLFKVAGTSAMTLNSTGLGVGGSPVSGILLTVGSTSSVSATANALQVLSNKATFVVTADGATNAAGTTINYSWANGGQGPLIFRNAAISNVMTLDASGNCGIGVTPSAWTTYSALQIRNGSIANYSPTQDLRISSNAYYASGIWKRIAAAFATQYLQDGSSGLHQWYVAATGAADSTITTFTTAAMTLDASGQLGIGVVPSAAVAGNRKLEIGGSTNAGLTLSSSSANASARNWSTLCNFNAFGDLCFNQSNAQGGDPIAAGTTRMMLDASGNLLLAKTAVSQTTLGFMAEAAGTVTSTLASSTTGSTFNVYSTGAAAYRFYVGMNGTISATNTTISAISDARLKENVQDIDVGLGAILALKPRKFDWKAGKGKDIKGDRGFIAQEFEQVFPQLVDEWKDAAPEGEAPYKSVRQDLIPVLVKAIQELTARVQTLETR